MKTNTTLELLSPAKNLAFGQAALDFGADAVYVGAPRFSARAAASTTLQEIENLCQYAHKFDARVYVAFNTILYEKELAEAERLIQQIYEAGADALIIQDMGILEMNLPPIALHASTQAHNVDMAKLLFLEKVGFTRAVLARELSLEQISAIRAKTNIELEAFVHGALCVSYSGQCYLSAYLGNRSGNRGECAQPCRLKYDLLDKNGLPIVKDKNILSLRDMNRSEHIMEMAGAGITSFKIEGRLKDISYVKNITAFYRKTLDGILEQNPSYGQASRGIFIFDFNPEPSKSFNRRFTDYFLNGRSGQMASGSPKSVGQALGRVQKTGNGFMELSGNDMVCNGDGLCFFDDKDELQGFSVNKTEGQRIFLPKDMGIAMGTRMFRNHDMDFDRRLARSARARRIPVDMHFSETHEGFRLRLSTPDNAYIVEQNIIAPQLLADNPQKAQQNIINQLSKTGNTLFSIRKLDVECSNIFFIPIPTLNQLRRDALQALTELLGSKYNRNEIILEKNNYPWPATTVDYRANISNSMAVLFYKRHGVTEIEQAFELLPRHNDKTLMTTKYCLRYETCMSTPPSKDNENDRSCKFHQSNYLNKLFSDEMGICPVHQKVGKDQPIPAKLKHADQEFLLEFDCRVCEMKIISPE